MKPERVIFRSLQIIKTSSEALWRNFLTILAKQFNHGVADFQSYYKERLKWFA